MVREATAADFDGLMELYTQLHDNPIPQKTGELSRLWQRILDDPCHHILVAEEEGVIAASCVCVVIPNLTHGQRPYALVENVVTDRRYRRRGLATQCLHRARALAQEAGCYKIMLLTGSREEGTLRFYRQAGYNSSDKTAFIQWL